MKKKVLIVSGTRAEFSLLESTINCLKKSRVLSPIVLATGMHTLKKFGYTLDYVKTKADISYVVPISQNGDMLSWFAEEISGISKYVKQNKPDCVIVLGDRDEPLAATIVAAHLGIPIAHIHGGDQSGESIVDTKNRNVITQYSTFHFPATVKSGQKTQKIIGSSKNITIVGAPAIDLLKSYKILTRELVAKKFHLDSSSKWLLVILHPEWIGAPSLTKQIESLTDALDDYAGEIIWIYPNSDYGSDVFINQIQKFAKRKHVSVFKSLPQEDYISILANVDLMIGNSSSGIIESAYFHIPVVNIGSRQNGRERASNVIDSTHSSVKIKSAMKKATGSSFRKRAQNAKQIYGNGDAGQKITSFLEKSL